MRAMRMLLVTLPFLWACGGVQVIFKSPVEERCSKVGLAGCPDLTEGVLLYVQGKNDDGKVKIEAGAALNAPDKLREFAKQLKQLNQIPGSKPYMKPVNEIIRILAKHKGNGAKPAAGTPGPGQPDPDFADMTN